MDRESEPPTTEDIASHQLRRDFRSKEELQAARLTEFLGGCAMAGDLVARMTHLIPTLSAPSSRPADMWLETAFKRADPTWGRLGGGMSAAVQASVVACQYLADLVRKVEVETTRLLDERDAHETRTNLIERA